MRHQLGRLLGEAGPRQVGGEEPGQPERDARHQGDGRGERRRPNGHPARPGRAGPAPGGSGPGPPGREHGPGRDGTSRRDAGAGQPGGPATWHARTARADRASRRGRGPGASRRGPGDRAQPARAGAAVRGRPEMDDGAGRLDRVEPGPGRGPPRGRLRPLLQGLPRRPARGPDRVAVLPPTELVARSPVPDRARCPAPSQPPCPAVAVPGPSSASPARRRTCLRASP